MKSAFVILLSLAGCAFEAPRDEVSTPRVAWTTEGVSEVDAPTVDARTAIATVLGRASLTRGSEANVLDGAHDVTVVDPIEPSEHAELGFYTTPALAEPRLAWHVVVEGAPPHTYRAYVDAHTGVMYDREDRTRRAPKHHARVYRVNPVESELEEVVFESLPEDARSLDDGEVRVVNCVDRRTCQPVLTAGGVRNVHHCELVPLATPGPDGSFLHIGVAGDSDPEDAFAEVQAYQHVRTSLASFRALLGETFHLRAPLTTVVNMRPPDLRSAVSICDGDRAPRGSRLQIEENAYFWPAGGLGPTALGDRVVLHQAQLSDWAYDGEIVFHEMTHAVINTVTPLAWRFLDEGGLDIEGGAMNEGFSDYFAAVLGGDAEMCPYAGRTEDGPAPMSTLDNTTRCTDVLDGEEHDEAEAWSGALWSLRRSLRSEAKRAMLDRALARVISSLGQHDGFEEAYALLLAELDVASEELVTSEHMTAHDAVLLRATVRNAPSHFEERGLPRCNGRVQELALGEEKGTLYLYGPNGFGAAQYGEQLIPSTMQIAIDVPFATDAIQITAASSYEYDETMKSAEMKAEPEIFALLKRSAAITWHWDLPRGTHDAEVETELTVNRSGARKARGVLRGHFEPGRYHLQLANRGADWALSDITVLVADAEGEFVDGKGDDARIESAPSVAPSCAAGGRGHGWGFVLAIAALLASRRRRS